MELVEVLKHIAAAVNQIDSQGLPHKNFSPGVGPYGEPQLVRQLCEYLNQVDELRGLCATKRSPDLLIRGQWALEFKIARPFGDNGKEAENWSVNLLHPYSGNTSAIGDSIKLSERVGPERKAVVVIGYEHAPARIELTPLWDSFDAIMQSVVKIRTSPRFEITIHPLIHPVHQRARIVGWEIL